MLNSAFDMGIGLILIFLLLSVAVSSFNELVEGVLERRSRFLYASIERLAGTELAEELYQTTWISSLGTHVHSDFRRWFRGGKDRRYPSYIPTEIFVDAVREVLQGMEQRTNKALKRLEEGADVDEVLLLLPPRVRALVEIGDYGPEALQTEVNKKLALAAEEIRGLFPGQILEDINEGAVQLRHWFESSMDRISGWYGRRIKGWLLAWGFLLAIVLNIDTLAIASDLWTNETARDALVGYAERTVDDPSPLACRPTEEDPFVCIDQAAQRLTEAEGLQLPMGWPSMPWEWGQPALDTDGGEIPGVTKGDDDRIPQSVTAWVYKLVGLILTGLAVVVGAPFWFDLLNKFINVRNAGPKPKTTTYVGEGSD